MSLSPGINCFVIMNAHADSIAFTIKGICILVWDFVWTICIKDSSLCVRSRSIATGACQSCQLSNTLIKKTKKSNHIIFWFTLLSCNYVGNSYQLTFDMKKYLMKGNVNRLRWVYRIIYKASVIRSQFL